MNLKFKIFALMLTPIYHLQRLIIRMPEVKGIDETLKKIENEKVSISRYGDGDFDQIYMVPEGYQESNQEMAKRLSQILKSNLEGHLVCIPDIFNGLSPYDADRSAWWRYYVIRNRKKVKAIVDVNKVYYDSLVSRCYRPFKKSINTKNFFDRFKQIFKDRDLLIIEGDKSRLGVGNDLFSGAKSIERILCPAENAFDKYDEILEKAKLYSKDKLIIIALGPTATILAYDLHKAGFWALDLGHLDIEYEWFIRGIDCRKNDETIRIEGKYVNEAKNGNIVEDCMDKKYLSEIVERII